MDLRRYLFEIRMTTKKFSESLDINYITVMKIYKGRPVNIESAIQIVEASEGNVTLQDIYPQYFQRQKAIQERFSVQIN